MTPTVLGSPTGEDALDFLAARPAALRASLRAGGGPGVPLGHDLRQRLRGPLGFDPGAARLHRSPVAAAAARRLRAQAFTIGHDIFFGEGQGEAASGPGLALLAHELTHVGQQTRAAGPHMQFWTPSGGDAMEQEAQRVARRAQESAEQPSAEAGTGGQTVEHQGTASHRTTSDPRPSLTFTLPVPAHTPAGGALPSQTHAGAPREASGPSGGSSARSADARAVADRVYELMRQEILQARRRGLGR